MPWGLGRPEKETGMESDVSAGFVGRKGFAGDREVGHPRGEGAGSLPTHPVDVVLLSIRRWKMRLLREWVVNPGVDS